MQAMFLYICVCVLYVGSGHFSIIKQAALEGLVVRQPGWDIEDI